MKLVPALLAAGAALLAACSAPLQVRGRFDTYGDVDAGGSAPAVSAEPVKVYYGTAPAGFTLRDNELKVEDGFAHRILGTVRVVWDAGNCDHGGFSKKDVVEAMRRTAKERGGNAVIYASSHISDEPRYVCGEVWGKDDYGGGWVVVLAETAPAAPVPAPAPAAAAAPATP
jgi:hypothetical protein